MHEIIDPQKHAKEGKSAYQRGDYLNAAHSFEAASDAFKAAGDVLNAAEMANNASVAFLQAGEAEKALIAVEGTTEAFASANDIRRQGMALGNRAAALEELSRNDEALKDYQESSELLEQAGEDQLRANVMNSISALQFRMGHQLEALASMQAGLAGIKHPNPKQRLIKRLLQIPFNIFSKKQKSNK